MAFQQFLMIVLAVYACYYFLLILYDRMSFRASSLNNTDQAEFVLPLQQQPVKVGAETCNRFEIGEHSKSEVLPITDAGEISSAQTGSVIENLPYDLGLETIAAPAGIRVASPKFRIWLGQQ